MNHTILEIFLYGCSSSPNGNQTRASILGGLRLFRSTMGLSYYPSCYALLSQFFCIISSC